MRLALVNVTTSSNVFMPNHLSTRREVTEAMVAATVAMVAATVATVAGSEANFWNLGKTGLYLTRRPVVTCPLPSAMRQKRRVRHRTASSIALHANATRVAQNRRTARARIILSTIRPASASVAIRETAVTKRAMTGIQTHACAN